MNPVDPISTPRPDPEGRRRERRLRGGLRRVAGTVLGWVVFASLCLVWGVLVVPATAVLVRFRPDARDRFRELTQRTLGLYLRSLPFLELRVERPSAPLVGPRILVANHQSWLDPIVMMSLEPGVRGPSQPYMFRVPVVRSVLRLSGFFAATAGDPAPLERMAADAEAARRDGGALLFFPEGTRSRSGAVGSFRRGAFRVAFDHQLPVQPVVIAGLDRVLPPGHLIAQAPGRALVRVRYLEPRVPPFGPGPRRSVVRELGERVRSSIVEELTRMRAEGAPAGGRPTGSEEGR